MERSEDIDLAEDEARCNVEANTAEGEDFVDAWTGAILEVIDSGRISIPSESADEFVAAVEVAGLTVHRWREE